MEQMLPVIDINGTAYTIDEQLHEVRKVDDPSDSARFKTNMEMLGFLAYYAGRTTIAPRWQDLEPGIDVLGDDYVSHA